MSLRLWALVYSKEDLTRNVQSFKNESTTKLIVRLALLAVNLFNVWYVIHLYEPYRLMMFFTNWTLLITCLYFMLVILAANTKRMGLLALHHIIFEISFMMNLIVVTVFWTVIYKDALAECNGHQGKINNVYLAHIGPGVSVLINWLQTDVVIRAAHVKMVVVIAILYGYVNYCEVKKLGKPLYWFLTWEDETSYYIYAALILVFTGVWFLLASFTLMIKPRPCSTTEQDGPP